MVRVVKVSFPLSEYRVPKRTRLRVLKSCGEDMDLWTRYRSKKKKDVGAPAQKTVVSRKMSASRETAKRSGFRDTQLPGPMTLTKRGRGGREMGKDEESC